MVERLGAGDMGVVFKAEDTTLERAVSLKFLAEHLLNDEEAKERFLREAKAAATIDHPNICHVHEIGEEGGKIFVAMACLEGAARSSDQPASPGASPVPTCIWAFASSTPASTRLPVVLFDTYETLGIDAKRLPRSRKRTTITVRTINSFRERRCPCH